MVGGVHQFSGRGFCLFFLCGLFELLLDQGGLLGLEE
jgi:hypothetical protein